MKRRFNDRWFLGVVDDVVHDDGNDFFHVGYGDFDEEEIDLGELLEAVCYHPALDAQHNLHDDILPEVGSMVLFEWDYRPRLGQVKEVTADRRPIVLQLWKPHRQAQDLVSARYAPSVVNDEPELLSITPMQVKL